MATDPREYTVRIWGVSTHEDVLMALDAVGAASSLTDAVQEAVPGASPGVGTSVFFECPRCQLRDLADSLTVTALVIKLGDPPSSATTHDVILYGDAVETDPVAAMLAFERRLEGAEVEIALAKATVRWTDRPSVRARIATEATAGRSSDIIAAVAADIGCKAIPPVRPDWS
jgi:hypothetical protein